MDILKACLDLGVTKVEEVPIGKLVLQPELRSYCKQNHCGRYGRSYSCPPFIGSANDLVAKLKSFHRAVIWQNVYHIEDSLDFEGMMDGQAKHNNIAKNAAKLIYEELGRENALILSAGGCSICDTCGIITNEPCRNINDALSSLEAYGVNVSKIGEVSGLKYINGVNTVTYFASAFFRDHITI